MSAAYLKTRSPRSLAHKGRTIAQAHPYVVAAAATVGALAISALVNRHLAKSAENDNPPAGPAARQWQHDPGFRIQWFNRFGR